MWNLKKQKVELEATEQWSFDRNFLAARVSQGKFVKERIPAA